MDDLTNAKESSNAHPKWHSPAIVVIAGLLVAGNLYFLGSAKQLHEKLNQLESSTHSDMRTIRESSEATLSATAKKLDELRGQLDDEHGRALQAASQASKTAQRHADDLAQKIESEQQQAQQQVTSAIGEVKDAAQSANTKVAEVIERVSTVDTRVSQTRSDLDKTVAELKSVQGDMGVQSGLIATNAKQLAALRELGERNYVEFDVKKMDQPQRVGNINIVLRKADPKRNRYTLDVVADDKKVEKRDRYINEPVQFYVSRARQPYEIVVNEVQKDRIVGYLAIPKVLSASR
jgi:DNA repair exonuclease SbcCD ATPase subunit